MSDRNIPGFVIFGKSKLLFQTGVKAVYQPPGFHQIDGTGFQDDSRRPDGDSSPTNHSTTHNERSSKITLVYDYADSQTDARYRQCHPPKNETNLQSFPKPISSRQLNLAYVFKKTITYKRLLVLSFVWMVRQTTSILKPCSGKSYSFPNGCISPLLGCVVLFTRMKGQISGYPHCCPIVRLYV
jgi:hypothetical protein